jgi:hypothetical protein
MLTTAVIAKTTADGVGREDVPVNDGVINTNTTKPAVYNENEMNRW